MGCGSQPEVPPQNLPNSFHEIQIPSLPLNHYTPGVDMNVDSL